MIKRLGLVTVLLLLSAILTACGIGGVKIDPKGETVTIKNDKGETVDISAGKEGKLPDGFPLALYNGAKIDSSAKIATNGKNSYTVALLVKGDPKAVADFYEKALKEKGIEVNRSDIESDGSIDITLMGENDASTAWIVVSLPSGESEIQVTILYGDK